MKRLTLLLLLALCYVGAGPILVNPYVFAHPAPTLVSATIPSSGATMTLVFSENVSAVDVSLGSFIVNGTVPTALGSIDSGSDGEATFVVQFSHSDIALMGDTVTLDYDAGTGGIHSTDTSISLASFTSFPVTNNSTQ